MEKNNLADTTWIKVEVDKGMFSSECAVEIRLYNGKKISLFADKSILKQKGGEWYLKVTKIRKENSTEQLILLPTEAFETSSRWASVPLNE
ncbi:hypothetical protein ES705_39450 [subsurface metagenome]